MISQDLIKSITDKKTLETVANSAKEQVSNLSSVAEKLKDPSGLMGNMTSVMQNAKNIISQNIKGITSNLTDSIKQFSSVSDIGLKTPLGDLSTKFGSMVSDVSGKTDGSAVANKPSFITSLNDSSVNPINLGNGGASNLLKGFNPSSLTKLASSIGLPSISNNSGMRSALSSGSGLFSQLSAGANSLIPSVKLTDFKSITSSITRSSNSGFSGGLLSNLTRSVNTLMSKSGIGSTETLIKDLANLYRIGTKVYSAVTGKNGSPLKGITSKFNSGYDDVYSLLSMSSRICPGMNQYEMMDYSSNKDLADLMMYRMSEQGMYGALDTFMDCDETQKYMDDRSYMMMSSAMHNRARYGDIHTVSTLQKRLGNQYTNNRQSLMYNTAYYMDDDDENMEEYTRVLSRMGMSGRQVVGNTYTTRSGQNAYVYSSYRTSSMYTHSGKIAKALTGSDTAAAVVSIVDKLFG